MNIRPWLIWGCAGLFYLYEMILRASPGVIAKDLMADFGVASTALGVLASFYYYSYVALQIPCGVIVDRLGARRVITYSTLLCAVGSILFACSTSLLGAQIGRFLIGAGSACAFISCLKIGSEWFSPARFAMIAGLTNMMGTVGGMVSGPPFAILSNNFGWRQATIIAAIIGVILAAICWLIMRDKPQELTNRQERLGEGLLRVARDPLNWLVAIVGGLMYVPISAFCELWAVPFLMEKYGVSNEIASRANIMLYLGIACGSPMAARLSNYLSHPIRVMSISALATAGLFMAAVRFDSITYSVMLIILFLAGVANAGQVMCFAAVKENVSNSLSGTAAGFTNAIVMMSGIIFQPLLGVILDMAWQGQFNDDGSRYYGPEAYQTAMMMIPLCFVVGWVMLQFIERKQTLTNQA
ncbi:MFS transporter [Candidatus Odyssella thessalonicensis]|uniref:MFS transporter n=1 Tax=Candidatus Odyssella thessalonicensis TaxID=84647 RepID=UPI000225A957|nr:MFS transporter [Candidatus Odyssella thessalonicensis]